MDWIFDNIKLVIAVAGIIAFWLNARSREKAGEAADYDGDGVPDTRSQPRNETTPMAQESEAEERARRIREEIKRKIQERMSGGAPSGPSTYDAPRPIATPFEIPRQAEPEVRPPDLPVRPAPPARNDEEIAARQRHLAERMAELAQEREATEIRAASLLKKQIKADAFTSRQTADAAESLARANALDLHNPANLRRAILWREILGRPVSQR